jgi:alpha-1,3-rhamnosyltransferase
MIEKKEYQVLVSIVVITYNSSKYIVETLESVKSQKYRDIELIISDDCSTDDTVDICKGWIAEHEKRFVNVKMVTTPKNTGVAPNCNRGINASKGEWIKLLVGDDKLFSYTISEFVDFTRKNDCQVCCCKLKMFGDDEKYMRKTETVYEKYYEMIDKDLKYQKKMNARELFVPGPGLFFSRELFRAVGGFVEEYPFAEEWPFTTKILNGGRKIFMLDKYLYNYRIRAGSLCREEFGMNVRVFRDMKKYVFKEGIAILIQNGDFLYAWHIFLKYVYLSGLYGGKSIHKIMGRFVLLLSPIACARFIIRRAKRLIPPPPRKPVTLYRTDKAVLYVYGYLCKTVRCDSRKAA